ncbi:MAG: histidinol-phosphate transaminase [Pirellulales bacterium]
MNPAVRDAIDAMEAYAPGEQPQGGKFIKLNTNENPYPCSHRVRLAIERACAGGLSRYPDPTASAFRHRAADLLGVSPDAILCGNGSDDLLTIVTRTFVGEGQRIRFPSPSYVLYRTLAEIQGARFDQIRFQPDWTLGADFVAPIDDLRLVYLANPNSPSGTALSPESVLRMARQLPCPLLVDEAYADFSASSCVELVAEEPRIVVSRSLSKSYSLAGLRFGYMVAHPDLVRQLNKVKDSYNCDSLSIAGATAAIDDQVWLAETRAKIITTRGRLTAQLRRLGFDPVESQANFVWSPHPRREVHSLYQRLKAEGVLVRYMNYPDWGEGLRISVGTDSQVDACLALLEDML